MRFKCGYNSRKLCGFSCRKYWAALSPPSPVDIATAYARDAGRVRFSLRSHQVCAGVRAPPRDLSLTVKLTTFLQTHRRPNLSLLSLFSSPLFSYAPHLLLCGWKSLRIPERSVDPTCSFHVLCQHFYLSLSLYEQTCKPYSHLCRTIVTIILLAVGHFSSAA